jgi:hypothetical protein
MPISEPCLDGFLDAELDSGLATDLDLVGTGVAPGFGDKCRDWYSPQDCSHRDWCSHRDCYPGTGAAIGAGVGAHAVARPPGVATPWSIGYVKMDVAGGRNSLVGSVSFEGTAAIDVDGFGVLWGYLGLDSSPSLEGELGRSKP